MKAISHVVQDPNSHFFKHSVGLYVGPSDRLIDLSVLSSLFFPEACNVIQGETLQAHIHPTEVSNLVGVWIFMARVVGHNEGLNHRLAVALRRVLSLFNHARFFVTTILHGNNVRYHFMLAGGPAVSTTASRA